MSGSAEGAEWRDDMDVTSHCAKINLSSWHDSVVGGQGFVEREETSLLNVVEWEIVI